MSWQPVQCDKAAFIGVLSCHFALQGSQCDVEIAVFQQRPDLQHVLDELYFAVGEVASGRAGGYLPQRRTEIKMNAAAPPESAGGQ